MSGIRVSWGIVMHNYFTNKINQLNARDVICHQRGHRPHYIAYLHMPRRLIIAIKKVIKTLLSVRRSCKQKGGKNQQGLTRLQLATLVKKRLFKAFTAVSGSSSAEEGYTDTNTYMKNTLNLLALEKGVAPGWISLLQFCCRDIAT